MNSEELQRQADEAEDEAIKNAPDPLKRSRDFSLALEQDDPLSWALACGLFSGASSLAGALIMWSVWIGQPGMIFYIIAMIVTGIGAYATFKPLEGFF